MPTYCEKNTGWISWFKKPDLGKVAVIIVCKTNCCKISVIIFISFFTDECKRYKEAIYLDPKYSIAITEVFAEMFSRTLIKPIVVLGDSIHAFNKSVLSE